MVRRRQRRRRPGAGRPEHRRLRRSARSSASRPVPVRSRPAPAFFTNQSITRGINLSDRSEFYIPWVMNQANPNQLFLGTVPAATGPTTPRPPAAGDAVWSPISLDLTSGCTGARPTALVAASSRRSGLPTAATRVYTGPDRRLVYHRAQNAVTSPSPTWPAGGQGNVCRRAPVTQFAVDRSNYRTAYAAFAGFNARSPGRNGPRLQDHRTAARPGRTSAGTCRILRSTRSSSTRATPNTLYAGTDVGAFVDHRRRHHTGDR